MGEVFIEYCFEKENGMSGIKIDDVIAVLIDTDYDYLHVYSGGDSEYFARLVDVLNIQTKGVVINYA